MTLPNTPDRETKLRWGEAVEPSQLVDLLERDRGRPRPLATDFAGAAELSGLSRSALYQAAGRGELPVRKWGARAIILLADLDDYLRRLPLGAFKAPGNGRRGLNDTTAK